MNRNSSCLGRADTVGFGLAVEVLDTIGSSVANLSPKVGFEPVLASGGTRISILAFEVANTIAKGANLFQSLSEENVQFLKNEVLHSEGIQNLVSTDMEELLTIAAADIRQELDVLSREVIWFGNLCKDPEWHNLGRYFSKLDSESLIGRSEAEMAMQELTDLLQHTSQLYHECIFEQDYQRRLGEAQSLNLTRKGESFIPIELKQQRKLVRSLKKKSLWSKNLEQIVEKIVDVVTYLKQAVLEAFGNNGTSVTLIDNEPAKNPQRLGTSGLALHYAKTINQIDNIASWPTSLSPNARNILYQGLPNSVKTALRSRLQMVNDREELSIAQVKAEMEKTLQWLVPIARNTTKVLQRFGRVGDWANTENEFSTHSATNSNLIRLQTLYHVDKQKIDLYILALVIWLHQLINIVKQRDHGFETMSIQSPTLEGPVSLSPNHGTQTPQTREDEDLVDDVCHRRLVPGISKSQEYCVSKKKGRFWALIRSAGNSPVRGFVARQNWEHRNTHILDIMDGLYNPI